MCGVRCLEQHCLGAKANYGRETGHCLEDSHVVQESAKRSWGASIRRLFLKTHGSLNRAKGQF